ncbi:MAG: hypothetical protein KatS3mg102_2962 [Planctomycetota bacterium]|nr:MAG: hypothetical protein KatS3mg102_2962 [Planctomycetota bacterium]
MFQRFNVQAREAIERAWNKACKLQHAAVEPEHLLASLAEDGESSFCSLLSAFAVPAARLSQVAPGPGAPAQHAAGSGQSSGQVLFAPQTRQVIEYAVEEADRLGHKRVGTSHFLLALLRSALERPGGARVLLEMGLELEAVRARVRELGGEEGGGKADVIPAVLFFELDRRAREAEAALRERIAALESEQRSLRAMLELVSERLARLEQRGR